MVIASLVKPNQVVPIELWGEEQRRDLIRLKSVEGAALLYFREAGRASTAKTKLAMLVIAAESLAGTSSKSSKCNRCKRLLVCPTCNGTNAYSVTDMEKLKNIFGEEDYKALYAKPESLRNKLMHGIVIDEQRASDLAETAYKQIRAYLQADLSLETNVKIKNVPRGLYGTSRDSVCLSPPSGWLPPEIDVPKVDWPKAFKELENADLRLFGEPADEPPDL